MRALCFALCFALGLALASGAAAQDRTTPGTAGAEAVVTAYSSAVAASDWDAAAALLDPEDLVRFQAFAAMLIEQEPFVAVMLGIEADAEPSDLIAAFIGQALAQNPVMADAMSSVQISPLGTVLEGDSLAHVVARTNIDMMGRPFSTVEANTARWDGAQWWMRLDGDLDAMIVGMELALENPELFEGEAIDVPPPPPPPEPEPVRDPKKG